MRRPGPLAAVMALTLLGATGLIAACGAPSPTDGRTPITLTDGSTAMQWGDGEYGVVLVPDDGDTLTGWAPLAVEIAAHRMTTLAIDASDATGDRVAAAVDWLAEHGAQGRGVMIDLHRRLGRTHRAVGYDELMKLMDADRVEVGKGDMVCLYTGFADLLLEMKKQPDARLLHQSCSGLDGRDERLLQWITDSGLAVLASDNYAVEIIPLSLSKPGPAALMPLHEHCLFKNGIHLGEMWYFRELAAWLRAHARNRFLLTAPPLRLPGAVGSPATPIATV